MNKTLRYALFLVAAITAVNASFALISRLIARELPESLWLRLFAILLGSLLSAVVITLLVIVATPVLREWLLTYRRLSRLENIGHPLLVRLSREAPGTYHHTLQVADLAAKAANVIGADSQLTRIAGYFHDIGKLNEPQYYVENQRGTNPHDLLDDPVKSASIIIGHVKEGLALGRQHGLPKEILDCIPQHHGTLVLKQFYDKAKERGGDVKLSQFRYPGPRPLSKEAGLLMLADNTEARVRALPHKSGAAVKEAVEEAIAERFKDKQLDLTGFTEKDYRRIRDSFTESFLALHHRRLPQAERQTTFQSYAERHR